MGEQEEGRGKKGRAEGATVGRRKEGKKGGGKEGTFHQPRTKEVGRKEGRKEGRQGGREAG